jgi:hypothetical protein
VIEAVNYDQKTQACQAHPALEILVGSWRFVPQQHILSTEELLILLQDYEHRHPQGVRILFRRLGYPYDGSPEGLHAIAQIIRGVEFRPEVEKK